MKAYFALVIIGHLVVIQGQQCEVLIRPKIGHDELNNHILTVTVRNGDYNRVIDTKEDEIILGLRDEINPPINKVVCNYLGEILNINPKLVDVIDGHSENERKTIQIDGEAITAEQIADRIMTALRECIEEERHLKPSIKHRNI